MSQGTIILGPRTRPLAVKAFIDHYKIDLTVYDSYEGHPEFKKAFPRQKVPVFITNKGVKMHETTALVFYFIRLADPESKLLGKNTLEFSLIDMWMSLVNSEVLLCAAHAFKPLTGDGLPYNKKAVDDQLKQLDVYMDEFEARLREYTYLVGERVSAADVFCAVMLHWPFQTLFGAAWRKRYPATARWFATMVAQPIVKNALPKGYKWCDKALDNVPPKGGERQECGTINPTPAKKEKAPKKDAPKEAKKDTPKAAAETPQQAPKPKHPLEALGKPSTPIDEWKRFYSNEETREVALPWFWKNFWNPDEWSMWRVDYKYNDELTLTFMSNNLVGGFFNRLSASTKYMFGCMVVYGENNNNGIVGAFIVRGKEFAPAFDVAPDWESYDYKPLDPSKEEDKDFFENMMAWDKPVVIDGKPVEIADGKVLK
ncbi:elongation factor 1-gamma 2 [Diutina catenulata]